MQHLSAHQCGVGSAIGTEIVHTSDTIGINDSTAIACNQPPTTAHAQCKQQEWMQRRSSSPNRRVLATRFASALEDAKATHRNFRAHVDAHVAHRHNALAADRARFAKRKAQQQQQQQQSAATTAQPQAQRLDPADLPAVQQRTTAHAAAIDQQHRYAAHIEMGSHYIVRSKQAAGTSCTACAA